MPKSTPPQKPRKDIKKEAEPVEEHLEEALEDIDEPEKAAAVAGKLMDEAAEKPAVEVAEEELPPLDKDTPQEQAQKAAKTLKQATEAAPSDIDEAAAALRTAAEEAAVLEGPAYEAVAEEIQAATGPEFQDQPEKLKKPRSYLRDAIVYHPGVSWLDKYDAELFILINNNIPRTPATTTFFQQLSFWFNGGMAWLLGIALAWLFSREKATRTLKWVAVPMWVAGMIVEGPIKLFFRRRRPFIDLVRTIVVGKKPGNWSFPSGHSATAFAGAWMLSRFLPRWRWLWYPIAGLVAFSRIFVGAHYPGDVLSGSLVGMFLAELTRRVMARITGQHDQIK